MSCILRWGLFKFKVALQSSAQVRLKSACLARVHFSDKRKLKFQKRAFQELMSIHTPGKRSTCTPSVYYRKSIWLVTVYHLTSVNKHVAEKVSMFNVSLLFYFTYCWNMLWQWILIMNTDTRFARKSRGFLQVLFLPWKRFGLKMLYRDLSCPCYVI